MVKMPLFFLKTNFFQKTAEMQNEKRIVRDSGIRGLLYIAVRLRVKKKVQNLNAMWYKEFAKNFATQGVFGHESP